MEELTRRDYRVIILYNFKRGLSTDECRAEMSNIFSDNCPSRSTIYRWYKQFQRGKFQLEDDERSGRPSEAVTPENIALAQKLLNENRRITYKQIEASVQIGAPAVHKILHDCLHVRKVYTLWGTHMGYPIWVQSNKTGYSAWTIIRKSIKHFGAILICT